MNNLYLLLKATVTKVITVPAYTRSDGTYVPAHQKTVHYDPDKSKHDVINGKGTSSQQKAHEKLSKHKDWDKWSDEEKHAHILAHATDLQVHKTFNGNVSKFKKAILEGKVPQAGHYNAVMSDEMGAEKRQKLLDELKEKVGAEQVENLMQQAAAKADGKSSGQKTAKDKYNEHTHKLAESHQKVADEAKAKQVQVEPEKPKQVSMVDKGVDDFLTHEHLAPSFKKKLEAFKQANGYDSKDDAGKLKVLEDFAGDKNYSYPVQALKLYDKVQKLKEDLAGTSKPEAAQPEQENVDKQGNVEPAVEKEAKKPEPSGSDTSSGESKPVGNQSDAHGLFDLSIENDDDFKTPDTVLETAKKSGCSKWLVEALEKAKSQAKTDLHAMYLMHESAYKLINKNEKEASLNDKALRNGIFDAANKSLKSIGFYEAVSTKSETDEGRKKLKKAVIGTLKGEYGEESQVKAFQNLEAIVGALKSDSTVGKIAGQVKELLSGKDITPFNELTQVSKETESNADNAPKEGDTKTVDGVSYVLKDGRWHKVSQEPDSSVFSKKPDAIIQHAKETGCSEWLVNALSEAKELKTVNALQARYMMNALAQSSSQTVPGASVSDIDSKFLDALRKNVSEQLAQKGLKNLVHKKEDSEDIHGLKSVIRNAMHLAFGEEAQCRVFANLKAFTDVFNSGLSDKDKVAHVKSLFSGIEIKALDAISVNDGNDGAGQASQPEFTQSTLHQFKHTKTGEDVYAVKLADKVDNLDFNGLKSTAKKFGGYYSSYSKGDAVSGFLFKDPKDANDFQQHIEDMEFFPDKKNSSPEKAASDGGDDGSLIQPKEGQSIGDAAQELAEKLINDAEGIPLSVKVPLQQQVKDHHSGNWFKDKSPLSKVHLYLKTAGFYNKQRGTYTPEQKAAIKSLYSKLSAILGEAMDKQGYKAMLESKSGDDEKTSALKQILKDASEHGTDKGYSTLEQFSVYQNLDGIKEILEGKKTALQKINAVKKLVKQSTSKTHWQKLVDLGKPQKKEPVAEPEKTEAEKAAEAKVMDSLPDEIAKKLAQGEYKGLTAGMLAGVKHLADSKGFHEWDKFIAGQMTATQASKMIKDYIGMFAYDKKPSSYKKGLDSFVSEVNWNVIQQHLDKKKQDDEKDNSAKHADDGPKEGDTKPGKGGTLVFHNGHWVLQDKPTAVQKDGVKEIHISQLTAPDVPEISGWKQVGGQKGSNPGGMFEDESGQKWYCKFPDDEGHAKSEVLAGELYKACGIPVAETKIVSKDGKIGIASKYIDGLKSDKDNVGSLKGARDGFAVDAWLGNWDAVGAGFDNLLSDGKGGAVRIDVGGSLEYRAQGAKKGKDFGKTVPEIKSMLDASKNAQTAHVFAGMSEKETGDSVRNVLKLTDNSIRNLVHAYGPGDSDAKDALAGKLIARKKYLAKQFPEIAKEFEPKKVIKIPDAPDFNNFNGNGPVSSKKWKNDQNNEIVNRVREAVIKDGVEGLQKLTYDQIDDDTGEVVKSGIPIMNHPSGKVQSYIKNVVDASKNPQVIKANGLVDVVVKALDGVYSKIDSIVGKVSFIKDAAQKIGRYAVLGKIVGGDLKDALKYPSYDKKAQENIKAAMYKESMEKFNKLTAQEKKSIKLYTGSYYDEMNPNVLNGNIGENEKALLSGMEKASVEIPEGFVLSRRINLKNEEDLEKLIGGEGLILQDFNGAVSTAHNPKVWSGNVQFRITCGKGVKGLYVADAPESLHEAKAISSHSSEAEVLLQHSTRFYVQKVYPEQHSFTDEYGPWGGKGSRYVIELIALPG